MKRTGAALRWITAATVSLALAACSSPTESNGEVFQLISVDGEALPAAYPDPLLPVDVYEVTEGRIRLNPNGSFLMDLWARCAPEPAEECVITGDGRQPMVGIYSRTDGYLQFGTRQYAATFTENSIVVQIQIPPSEGQWPMFTMEFRR